MKETLHIRAEERDPIDRAARASGKSRSEFILNASRRAAEEVLLEQIDQSSQLVTFGTGRIRPFVLGEKVGSGLSRD